MPDLPAAERFFQLPDLLALLAEEVRRDHQYPIAQLRLVNRAFCNAISPLFFRRLTWTRSANAEVWLTDLAPPVLPIKALILSAGTLSDANPARVAANNNTLQKLLVKLPYLQRLE